MAQMLPALAQQSPELAQAIAAHPEAFMRMVQETTGGAGMPAGGGAGMPAGGGGECQGGPQMVSLTEEEGASVQRLAEMCGVDRSVAAQAYLACDKSEEMAANFLLEDSER